MSPGSAQAPSKHTPERQTSPRKEEEHASPRLSVPVAVHVPATQRNDAAQSHSDVQGPPTPVRARHAPRKHDEPIGHSESNSHRSPTSNGGSRQNFGPGSTPTGQPSPPAETTETVRRHSQRPERATPSTYEPRNRTRTPPRPSLSQIYRAPNRLIHPATTLEPSGGRPFGCGSRPWVPRTRRANGAQSPTPSEERRSLPPPNTRGRRIPARVEAQGSLQRGDSRVAPSAGRTHRTSQDPSEAHRESAEGHSASSGRAPRSKLPCASARQRSPAQLRGEGASSD
jgi:hypothetical protein